MDTKHKLEKVKGIIIKETKIKEIDKVITILTKEKGLITVTAFSSRSQKSKNIAKTGLFTCGNFEIKNINDKYCLNYVDVIDYFDGITDDLTNITYGSYFLEVMNYFCYENVESGDNLKLVYYALKALIKNFMDKKLVKAVFELRCLYNEGLYIESDALKTQNKTVKYTWDFVINNRINSIWGFKLDENILKQFIKEVSLEFKKNVDYKFKSLELL